MLLGIQSVPCQSKVEPINKLNYCLTISVFPPKRFCIRQNLRKTNYLKEYGLGHFVTEPLLVNSAIQIEVLKCLKFQSEFEGNKFMHCSRTEIGSTGQIGRQGTAEVLRDLDVNFP